MNDDRLKNTIYKFLDNYYGTKFHVNKIPYRNFLKVSDSHGSISFSFSGSTSLNTDFFEVDTDEYQICSDIGNSPIMSFRKIRNSDNRVSVINQADAIHDIKSLFKISYDKSAQYVRNWFFNRQNLKDLNDLIMIAPIAI